MQQQMGDQGTVPYIHNLDTWRVVAFIPQPFYSWKQLEKKLSRPQSQFRHAGKEEKSIPLMENKPWSSKCRLIMTLMELSWLWEQRRQGSSQLPFQGTHVHITLQFSIWGYNLTCTYNSYVHFCRNDKWCKDNLDDKRYYIIIKM